MSGSIADRWPPGLRALVDLRGEVEMPPASSGRRPEVVFRRLPDGRYEIEFLPAKPRDPFA